MNQNLIPEETYVQFHADLMIVQEECMLNSLDSLQKKERFDSLYKSFNLTPEQIEQTKKEYNKDLKRWQLVYDKIILRLDSLQKTQSSKTEDKP